MSTRGTGPVARYNTITSVAASMSNVTLLPANINRVGATVYNDSTGTLYLKMGASADTSSYTVAMASQSYFETPFGWTGQIDGVWSNTNGQAVIGELT